VATGEVAGTNCGIVTRCKAEEMTRAPGYAKYAQLFGNTPFIWTRNLLLDSLVLSRYVVQSPAK